MEGEQYYKEHVMKSHVQVFFIIQIVFLPLVTFTMNKSIDSLNIYAIVYYFLVDGGWSKDGNFSTCNATCGDGMKTKTEHCDNPSPAHDGNQCSCENFTGTVIYCDNVTATIMEACNEKQCPTTKTSSMYELSHSNNIMILYLNNYIPYPLKYFFWLLVPYEHTTSDKIISGQYSTISNGHSYPTQEGTESFTEDFVSRLLGKLNVFILYIYIKDFCYLL